MNIEIGIAKNWEFVKPELDKLDLIRTTSQIGQGGHPRMDNREIYQLWSLFTRFGLSWREMDRFLRFYGRPGLPSIRTIFRRYREWTESGILERVFRRLTSRLWMTDLGFLDASFIKSKSGLKEAGGFGFKGRGCNVQLMINENYQILDFEVYSAQTHEVKTIENFLGWTEVRRLPATTLADRAYDSGGLRNCFSILGLELSVPYRSNSKNPLALAPAQPESKQRWKIERFFSWFKKWRHFNYRYESKTKNFKAYLFNVFSIMLLSR